MSEIWYDFVKPKYGEKAKLYYMNIDRFIVCIKTKDIYLYIANDVERTFDTSKSQKYYYLEDKAKRLLG